MQLFHRGGEPRALVGTSREVSFRAGDSSGWRTLPRPRLLALDQLQPPTMGGFSVQALLPGRGAAPKAGTSPPQSVTFAIRRSISSIAFLSRSEFSSSFRAVTGSLMVSSGGRDSTCGDSLCDLALRHECTADRFGRQQILTLGPSFGT